MPFGEDIYVSSSVAKEAVSFLWGTGTLLERWAYGNKILGIIMKEGIRKGMLATSIFPNSMIFLIEKFLFCDTVLILYSFVLLN